MTQENQLGGQLNGLAAFSLVAGTMIGTGVFLKAATMSQLTGSGTGMLLAWIIAGILSLLGALTYAELGSLFPQAGGEYRYFHDALSPFPAFLYGWMRFWIMGPGSIAAFAVGAATFLGYGSPVAVGFIAIFTALNCLNVQVGGGVQSGLTLIKIAIIVGVSSVLWMNGKSESYWSQQLNSTALNSGASWGAWGGAILAALWAYDGWNNLPMVASEVKNPQKIVPLALILGTLVVMALYLTINASYLNVLSFQAVAESSSSAFPNSPSVLTQATSPLLGENAKLILSLLMAISALGAMNGSILTGARVPWAMARDGLFFKSLAYSSPKSGTPIPSVLSQGILGIVLALSGTFDQLTDMVVFTSWFFYALAGAVVIYLRRTKPDLNRPFRVPGYPWVPGIFVVVSAALLLNTWIDMPLQSTMGVGVMALGAIVYRLFWRTQ